MDQVSPRFIIEGLMQRGYPAHVAQGFVMNMMDESGLRPGINEAAPVVPGSRGGFGLYQLTGPRRTAYEQFARQRGVDFADPNAQLDFLDYEMKGPESRAAKSILSTQNPQEAAVAIARDFLRPASEHLQNRVARYSGADVAADAMATLGKGGGAMTPDQIKADATAQPTGAQSGLMGMAGGQKRAPINERFRDPDFWNELALTFHSMSSFPNEAAIRSLEGRVATSRERKKEKDQLNKTIAFFEKMGRDDLVQLAQVSPSAALNLYGQSTKPGYKAMTGAQVNQMYPGANLPADKLFNVSPTGQITQVGGGGVTVDMSGGGYKDKYWEEDVKSLAKRIDAMKQGGAVAAENLQTLQVMRDLYEQSPSGAIMGRFAEIFPEATDASAIVNSLRVSLAPKLRVEGSGSTSDIEYEGMLQSLGSFRNSPQANKAIIDLMMAKMELNAKRAEIANQVRPGVLDPYEAANQIQQLETQLWSNNPLIQQVKELAGAAPKRIQQPAAGSQGQGGSASNLSDEDLLKKYSGGGSN